MTMSRKYRIDKSLTYPSIGMELYRIVALRSFGDVKAGDIGGFVSGYHNLSHQGECWIADDAVARDNACVQGDAILSGDALLHGNAIAGHGARISGNAILRGNAAACDNAIVGRGALLEGLAKAGHGANICAKRNSKRSIIVSADVTLRGPSTVTPVCLTSYGFPIAIQDKGITIGCSYLTFDNWQALTPKQCAVEHDTDAGEWWGENKKIIMALARHVVNQRKNRDWMRRL